MVRRAVAPERARNWLGVSKDDCDDGKVDPEGRARRGVPWVDRKTELPADTPADDCVDGEVTPETRVRAGLLWADREVELLVDLRADTAVSSQIANGVPPRVDRKADVANGCDGAVLDWDAGVALVEVWSKRLLMRKTVPRAFKAALLANLISLFNFCFNL